MAAAHDFQHDPGFAEQQDALSTLLESLLSPEGVRAALTVWSRDYAHRPGALRAYANCLVREFGVPLGLREMHRQLVQHLLLPATRRGPALLAAAAQAPDRAVPALTRAFALLTGALLARCGQQDPKAATALRSTLVGAAMTAKLSRADRELLVAWLDGSGPVPARAYDEALLRELVHAAWAGLCTLWGPPVADRQLGAAVHAAEEQCAEVRRLL